MRQHFSPTNLALIAVFTGLIAASTIWPGIQIAGAVPISLQTFAVLLAGAVLGPWRGAIAVIIYLVLGTAGMPIFANRMAGAGVWAKPTAGFLVGFVFAAFVTGWIVRALRRAHRLSLPGIVLATGVGSLLVINGFGWGWYSHLFDSSLRDTLTAASAFVVTDVAKLVLAATVAWTVHRAYPGLLPVVTPRIDRESQQAVDPAADPNEAASV